jgi:hypothetical protein
VQLFDRTGSRFVIGNAAARFLEDVGDDRWIPESWKPALQSRSEIAQHSLNVRGEWPAGVVEEVGLRGMVHAIELLP